MIIGNGFLANAFSKYKDVQDVVVFASGVSNSQCTSNEEFLREYDLIKDITSVYKNSLFVYFSSCSIYDDKMKHSLYVDHKLNMEGFIKIHSKKFLIIRTSNPIGQTKNRNTILNFLYDKINTGEYFEIWKNAKRNLIDIDDLYKITSYILDNHLFLNSIVNVASTHYYSVYEIVKTLEKRIGKKGKYVLKDLGGYPLIDTKEIDSIVGILDINFDHNYLANLCSKYY